MLAFLGFALVEVLPAVGILVFFGLFFLGLVVNLLLLVFNLPLFLIPQELRGQESLWSFFWRRVIRGDIRP